MPTRARLPATPRSEDSISAVRPKRTRGQSFRPGSIPEPEERFTGRIGEALTETLSQSTPPPPSSMDASFRVYTANELRSVPLRASYRPPAGGLEDLKNTLVDAKAAGPRQALTWLGMGIGGGVLLLALVLVAFSLSDDSRAGATATKSASTSSMTSESSQATPAQVDPSANDPSADPAPNDMELPDDAPVGVGRAASKRGGKAPKRK